MYAPIYGGVVFIVFHLEFDYLVFLSTGNAPYPQITPCYPQSGLIGLNLSIPYMGLQACGCFQPVRYSDFVQLRLDLIQI